MRLQEVARSEWEMKKDKEKKKNKKTGWGSDFKNHGCALEQGAALKWTYNEAGENGVGGDSSLLIKQGGGRGGGILRTNKGGGVFATVPKLQKNKRKKWGLARSVGKRGNKKGRTTLSGAENLGKGGYENLGWGGIRKKKEK